MRRNSQSKNITSRVSSPRNSLPGDSNIPIRGYTIRRFNGILNVRFVNGQNYPYLFTGFDRNGPIVKVNVDNSSNNRPIKASRVRSTLKLNHHVSRRLVTNLATTRRMAIIIRQTSHRLQSNRSNRLISLYKPASIYLTHMTRIQRPAPSSTELNRHTLT